MNDATECSKISELIKLHYTGLLNHVRGKVKDRELAADLVHQAIAITLEQVRSGRVSTNDQIAGYVFNVSMNLLRNHRRNMDNRTDLRADPEVLADMEKEGLDNSMDDCQTRKLVRKVLESVNRRDREVITRFYLDEQEREMICRELDLSSIQFNQVISRARQRLKVELESSGFKGSDLVCMLLLV